MSKIARIVFLLFITVTLFSGLVYASSVKVVSVKPESPVCHVQPVSSINPKAIWNYCPPVCREDDCCLQCWPSGSGCVCSNEYICY
jgi:hypothetical protein